MIASIKDLWKVRTTSFRAYGRSGNLRRGLRRTLRYKDQRRFRIEKITNNRQTIHGLSEQVALTNRQIGVNKIKAFLCKRSAEAGTVDQAPHFV